MADETHPARYRAPIHLALLLAAGLTVALPLVAIAFAELPAWVRILWPALALPAMWWWTLFRLVYRIDLTDTHLRLRALLASWDVPLAEVAEIGRQTGQGLAAVARRDGRKWTVASGPGLVDFADRVSRSAPGPETGVTRPQRAMDRMTKFFER